MQTVPIKTTIIGGPVPIPIYTNIDILSSDILIEEFKNLSKIKLYNFNKIIGTAYEKAEYLKSSGNKGKGLQGEQFKKIQPDNPGFIIKKNDDNERQDDKESWKILFLNELKNKVEKINDIDTNNTDTNKRSIMHLIGKYSYYFLKWHYDVPIKLGGSKVRGDYKYIKLIKTIEKILNPHKQGGGGGTTKGGGSGGGDDNLTYINSGLTGIKYNKDLDEIFKTLEKFMIDGIVLQLKKEINNIVPELKMSIKAINKNYTEKIQKKEAAEAAKAAKAATAATAKAAKAAPPTTTTENVKWIYRGKRLPQKGEIVERIRSELNNNEWIENKIEDWEIKEDLADILNKTSFGSNITFKKYFDVYLPINNKITEIKNKIKILLEKNIGKLNNNYNYVDENNNKIINFDIKEKLTELKKKI